MIIKIIMAFNWQKGPHCNVLDNTYTTIFVETEKQPWVNGNGCVSETFTRTEIHLMVIL